MNNFDLKPCPFCLNQAELVNNSNLCVQWHVECTNPSCKARTKRFMTTDQAIGAWNNRLKVDRKETEFILTDKDYDDEEFTCRNCGQIFLFDKDFVPDYKFCPYCGCKITKYINPEKENDDEEE